MEQRRMGGEHAVLGVGLAEAIRAAIASSGEPVDDVYGDLDGHRYRSEEWGFAQLRSHAVFRGTSPCRTFAGCWGDCGAAVGALHCIQAATGYHDRGAGT
jgi:3-oxoacyl-[acyl-carrier-protein] synthase-1